MTPAHLRRLSMFLALLTWAACSSESGIGPHRVVEVRMVPESVSVAAGDTVRLQAFPLDADTAFLPQLPVNWSTESAAVATVDGLGLITGVATGTTHILATAGSVTGSAVVTVP